MSCNSCNKSIFLNETYYLFWCGKCIQNIIVENNNSGKEPKLLLQNLMTNNILKIENRNCDKDENIAIRRINTFDDSYIYCGCCLQTNIHIQKYENNCIKCNNNRTIICSEVCEDCHNKIKNAYDVLNNLF